MDISSARSRIWVQNESARQGARTPAPEDRSDPSKVDAGSKPHNPAADREENRRFNPLAGPEQTAAARPAPLERLAGKRSEGLSQSTAAPDIDLAAAHLPPAPWRK